MDFLSFLVRPGSWSDNTCDEYIVLPPDSLAVMLFYIITRTTFGVASFDRWVFTPESVTASI